MPEPPSDYLLLWDEQFQYADGPLNYVAGASGQGPPPYVIAQGGWRAASDWHWIVDGNAIRSATNAEANGGFDSVAKQVTSIPADAINGDWNLHVSLLMDPTNSSGGVDLNMSFDISMDVAAPPGFNISLDVSHNATVEMLGYDSGPFAWNTGTVHELVWRKRGVTHSILIDGVQKVSADHAALITAPYLTLENDPGQQPLVGGSPPKVQISRLRFYWLPRYEAGAI